MFDKDERGVDAVVDVFDLAKVIKHRTLFTGGERVEQAVARTVLPQDFPEFGGHREAVFALVAGQFNGDRIALSYTDLLSLLFVDDDVKNVAPRHQSALERLGSVDRAKHAL